MKLFGFELIRQNEDVKASFVEPYNDAGAMTLGGAVGGAYGFGMDTDNSAKSESELIARYRGMMNSAEIQQAVDEVVNELVHIDSTEKVVKIVLDDVQVSAGTKRIIEDEFNNVLTLLDFSNNAYEIMSRFFVDGRLNYHIAIDKEDPTAGIQALHYIDPRKIRLVREFNDTSRARNGQDDKAHIKKVVNEFYVYSEIEYGAIAGLSGAPTGGSLSGLNIAKDSIARVTSGIVNENNTAVLSWLHQAYKPLNQLRSLEDAQVIYTLVRSPERRIFYVDVGSLPKAKAEQYLYDMMARHKNRVTYDASNGTLGDSRKMMCYALDTKIPLLDGRTLELHEIMSEYEQGKKNWVYSCDPKTGKFYPGPVSWAGITKRNSEVVRVTFDNGKSVVCTPDHKFPVWGKGFVEAQHLTPEDSIIPGYRRDKMQHEQIYLNDEKRWEFTHREVAKWKDEVGITDVMAHDASIGTLKYPGVLLQFIEDQAVAQIDKQEVIANVNANDKLMGVWRELNMGARPGGRDTDFDLAFTGKDLYRIYKRAGFRSWHKYKLQYETVAHLPSGRVRKECVAVRGTPEARSNIKGKSDSKGYKAEILRNHRITSVVFLEDRIDVGSMTIDANETYHSHHTYLLDAGVYTKNTLTEDYWFPRREGNRSTEIDVLPSSGQLMDNETLRYFQNKLYKSLNVPIGRLQPEQMAAFGRTSEMTREEAKFSKFVNRVRARFTILFDVLMERQLVLKQVCTADEWAILKNSVRYDFNKDNYYTELLELEIMRERINAAKEFDELSETYLSKMWIRKKVLRLTDEEIEELEMEREREREYAMATAQGEFPDGNQGEPEQPPEELPPEEAPPARQESTKKKKAAYGVLT